MSRALLFDVDGVLIHGYHFRPELRQKWDETLFEDLGIDPDEFRHKFIFDAFIKKVIVGKMALIDALDRVLPGLGYQESSANFVRYWLSHDSRVNHPLLDAIRKLGKREDIRLYIATNQEHMRAFWLWHQLGFGDVFADIFYSARLGVKKPDPAYFKQIDRRLGPLGEPPLFFDDTPDVVQAANTAGWEAVRFDSNQDFFSHPWIAERLD